MLLRRLTVVISRFQSTKIRSSSIASKSGKMQEGYVEVNKVPTHIYTWGQWVEDKFEDRVKEIVVIITGNPGLPGFYTKFGSSLYNELDKKIPIWIIGHAGHDEPKKELELLTPSLMGNEHLYDLQGQLNHKIDFINRFLPKDVQVYLVGHSVGSKFCLDLLKVPQFSDQVQHAYLLFPTIERMIESKKGRLVPTVDRFFFLLRIFYNIFNLMPSSWKRAVVKWQCRRQEIPEEFFEPSIQYTNPPVIDKIWFLALDEMQKIRQLDDETVKSNMNRLKLYYGSRDDWVNNEFYHEIVEAYPEIDAEMCQKGYEHAFVIKSSCEVGKMVSEWITLKRSMKPE